VYTYILHRYKKEEVLAKNLEVSSCWPGKITENWKKEMNSERIRQQ
jgi:hypothetical protein